MSRRQLILIGLDEIGEVGEGDALAPMLIAAIAEAGEELLPGDVIVVAQKVVSKSEGRAIRLADVMSSAAGNELAASTGNDPRLMTLLLGESREILRQREGLVIVEDVRGLVLANAGIDASNVSADSETVLLLPDDPDDSARRLREEVGRLCGVRLGVLVIDSIGRAWRTWRKGTVGTAIGVAGVPALLDLRGRPDMFGRPLQTSELGLADEIAAAASLLMGQADERCPAVLVRGLDFAGEGSARDLLRPREQDLFR